MARTALRRQGGALCAVLVFTIALGLVACSDQRPAVHDATLALLRFEDDLHSRSESGESLSLAVRLSGPAAEELYLVHDESELAWRFGADEIERARIDDAAAAGMTHMFEGICPPAGGTDLPGGQYRVIVYGRDRLDVEQRVRLRVPEPSARQALTMPRLEWDDGGVGLVTPAARTLLRIYDEDRQAVESFALHPGLLPEPAAARLQQITDDEYHERWRVLIFAFVDDSELVLVGSGL